MSVGKSRCGILVGHVHFFFSILVFVWFVCFWGGGELCSKCQIERRLFRFLWWNFPRAGRCALNSSLTLHKRPQIEGSPKPDRDAVDATRRTAYDAANDFLARKRATRAPRRPSDRPPPNVKMLHRLEGFRCFSSMEQAVMEVTEAVLGEEGVCRGIGADLAEVGRRLTGSPIWGRCFRQRRVWSETSNVATGIVIDRCLHVSYLV